MRARGGPADGGLASWTAIALPLILGCGRIDFAPRPDGTAATDTLQTPLPNRLLAWGSELNGNFLGAPDQFAPYELPGVADVTSVDAGRVTCVVARSGTATCWGETLARGNGGTPVAFTTPTEVVNIDDFLRVRVPRETACGLRGNGELWCWGGDSMGALGDDVALASSDVPVRVAGGALYRDFALAADSTPYACAVRTTGEVDCWGADVMDRLGNGAATTAQHVPAPVTGITDAITIATGETHACLVRAGGAAYCWGNNTFGQLGTGDQLPRDVPAAVVGGHRFVQLDSMREHTCGLDDMQAVWCWGDNVHGKLGVGDLVGRSTATLVAGLPPIAEIAVGHSNTYARTLDGRVFAWGAQNEGALGIPELGLDQWQPVRITGLTDVIALDAKTAFGAVAIQQIQP